MKDREPRDLVCWPTSLLALLVWKGMRATGRLVRRGLARLRAGVPAPAAGKRAEVRHVAGDGWKAAKGEGMGKEVIVYTQPGWSGCDREKEFLSQKEVAFTARNIREDPAALEELLKLGYRATPVTIIDGEVVAGFDRGKLERLLGLS